MVIDFTALSVFDGLGCLFPKSNAFFDNLSKMLSELEGHHALERRIATGRIYFLSHLFPATFLW
jgi:hypothetical protein